MWSHPYDLALGRVGHGSALNITPFQSVNPVPSGILHSRYFVSLDQSTDCLVSLLQFDTCNPVDITGILEVYGNKHKLSGFCSCPVCTKNTIEELLRNPTMTSHLNKSHRALSFSKESEIYQNKLKNNESEQYLTSKTYAKKIIG